MKIHHAQGNFSYLANIGSRMAFCLLVGAGVFLFIGFIRFATIIASFNQPSPPVGDGIVVLTGGKSRIDSALQLLEDGRAKRLLITGVYRETTKNTIMSLFPAQKELFSCCIDLDWNAMDTKQNGLETAKWMEKQKFSSLIVVTSDYHMPRSMLEMTRAMPDIRLLPYVARNKNAPKQAVIGDSEHLRMMVREFIKTMVSSSIFKSPATTIK